MRTILLIAVMFTAPVSAADWNQWRGPNRNGLVEESPPLATTWPDSGPEKLWQSEEAIVGDSNKAGGFGSVVVVDGRVYVFSSPKHREPIITRTLSANGLVSLGWSAKKPAADLADAVERARVSVERAALKDNKSIIEWVGRWTAEQVTDAAVKKEFGAWINDRLLRGMAAIDLALLDKLAGIKDTEFENAAAVDKWLDEQGVQGELRKQIVARFPTTRELGDDVIHCLDAANGKTLWKQVFPSEAQDYGGGCTPCIDNGKCYLIGADSAVYCLDAKTGQKLWQRKAGTGAKQCSFVVADGLAIIPAGPLTAFDAKTGDVRWALDDVKAAMASPACWSKDGKTYVIVRDNAKISCVDVKAGRIAWQLPDVVNSASPTIAGDYLAIWHGYDGMLRLYELSGDKPKLLWNVACGPDYGASPTIYNGYVYALGANGWACVDLKTGQAIIKEKTPRFGAYASPVFADGKIIIQGGESNYGDGSLVIALASPDRAEILARAKISMLLCTTPSLVDGRLYCRLNNAVACYDLRKSK